MTPRPIIEVGEIASMLAREILPLCQTILANGVRQGDEWRVGSVAGERGTSMGVRLTGPRAGVWIDSNKTTDKGDALDLVAAVEFGGDKRQALRWARGWLGLEHVDPATLQRVRRQAEAEDDKAARRAAAQDKAKRERASRIFLAAEPKIAGTPVERYLLGRGIDFAAIGRQPGALRYAPELPDPENGELHPTMVAAITGPSGHTIAVHRTFLKVHADGRVTKADIVNANGKPEAKFSLGKYAGGCIRLWRGASGKSLKDAVAGEWVIIGEGIEDTATAVMAAPEYRALVAVSGGGFQSLKLPEAIGGVILLGQNETNAKAAENWERVIAHYQAMGKRVRIVRPDPAVKDVNDMLTRSANLRQGASS
jgi:hypothetical protein